MSSAKADAVIILSHLMESDGSLGNETRLRADKGVELARVFQCKILTMGWAYRPDSQMCISQAVADYIVREHQYPPANIIIDSQSRETVGDAYFSKKLLNMTPHKSVVAITSQYHEARTAEIFQFIYGAAWSLRIEGVPVEATSEQLEHEAKSINAFRHTFRGIRAGDDEAIGHRLASRHPFYNGDVYPTIVVK